MKSLTNNRIKNLKQKSIKNHEINKQLSLVVCSKGIENILKLQIAYLKKQNLASHLWELLFIFREGSLNDKIWDPVSYIKQHFPSAQILFLPKNKALYEMRNLAFTYCDSSIIYFLDEDVLITNPQQLNQLLEVHNAQPQWTVIGGSYLDHKDCTFWGRVYNWIVRLWVTKHQSPVYKDLIPAGNLSVKVKPKMSARFYSPKGFGAEEIFFLNSLHKESQLSCRVNSLDTHHLAQHSLRDFFKRAWFHGQNFSKQKKNSWKENLKFFLKEPGAVNLKAVALLYFIVLRLSFWISKIKPS